ncbi:50S ribosomal protein L25/general stress protein Ctc [Desulfonema magnum]|uniref:Large ribosomal subunit protein bL25 n=1 Tax=Desulfonema magnum TaxID=45655 RepID=A0A975GT65_9BACT|nr:50S ribosomal protein L25/general stress protein Ctc [Desulfonema magnum]QTA91798.1 50S ribosomal protein L25 [Desulfonema magnum]
MELIELNANIRTATGKGPARALRREGKMPAILYGPDTEPVMLSVGVKALEQAMKKSKIGQLLVTLAFSDDGGTANTRSAMMKELQIEPLSRNFLHVDFNEISMDRKIRVRVPIIVKGRAKGVEDGGMLQVVRREVEVLCLPGQIPEAFEIDVTDLDMGDSIHIDEIPLEGDIEIPADVNFTVLTVLSPKGSKLDEEEEAEGEEEEEEAEGEAAE